jgi:hypothetical protein
MVRDSMAYHSSYRTDPDGKWWTEDVENLRFHWIVSQRAVRGLIHQLSLHDEIELVMTRGFTVPDGVVFVFLEIRPSTIASVQIIMLLWVMCSPPLSEAVLELLKADTHNVFCQRLSLGLVCRSNVLCSPSVTEISTIDMISPFAADTRRQGMRYKPELVLEVSC